MDNDEYLILPDLIELNQFGDNFSEYLEAVYDCFKRDFIDSHPVFRGTRLGLKKYPLREGKEATFWHMTTEGAGGEETRTRAIRRMERIRWPAAMINQSEHPSLRVWENTRHNETSVLIFNEREEYIVVLRKRKGYLLPWTAYLVTYRNQREKLMREYDAYRKSKGR